MSERPRIWEWLPGLGRNWDVAVTHFADEVGASLSEQNAALLDVILVVAVGSGLILISVDAGPDGFEWF